MIGTMRKLKRFFDKESGQAVVFALDHGAGQGLVPGLEDAAELVGNLGGKRVQGVVLNRGMARALGADLDPRVNLIVSLSAGTRHGVPAYNKTLVCSTSEAMRLGADAVAVQVNIGNDLEDRMLADFGAVVDDSHAHGMPVAAVIRPRGELIVNESDKSLIAHAVTLGGELSADMVVTPYSGESESFGRACAYCPAPVFVTGGPAVKNFNDFLKTAREALDAGAAGIWAGRNLFQHKMPLMALDKLIHLVHG